MRVLLYSGKGGVGKTSLAAATAVGAARRGRRTLVLSTDAAHSLGDALGETLGPEPRRITDRLDATEVDVNRELASHWGVIHEFLSRYMRFQGVDDVVAEEMAILPGMEELFSLLKVRTLAESGRYDVLVVDCAPTGETVRMLGIPDVLGFYFARIFPVQRKVVRTVRPVVARMTDLPLPTDDVFAAIKALYERLRGVAPLLQDPRRSSIRLVLNPERMVIEESRRLYTYLGLFGFPVDAVIANRVLPEEAASGYFAGWADIQARHLAEARETFAPVPFLQAPLFEREMVGLPLLERFATEVFGEGDPAAVLHVERPLEVRREGKGYALYVRLPFAEKDHIQVFTHGEELVVQVDNQRRNVLLPRTLASRRLLGAAFEGRRLRVAFGERET